jgi:hypothetical protein
MTGFKQGASDDDPLAGEEDDQETEERLDNETEVLPMDAHGISDEQRSASSSGLPWIFERNGITDGREKTVQLHLQQQTITGERELVTTLEQQLNESVNKADAREAAYLVAMNHVDEVADQLREWGYDH